MAEQTDIVERIKAWREDETQGYDTAIALVCEAETTITTLTAQLEEAQRKLAIANGAVDFHWTRAEQAEAKLTASASHVVALTAQLAGGAADVRGCAPRGRAAHRRSGREDSRAGGRGHGAPGDAGEGAGAHELLAATVWRKP